MKSNSWNADGSYNPPKFKNKNGSLTRYSFVCGYIEQKNIGEKEFQLYGDGPCYHVRGFDRAENAPSRRMFWETFNINELTKAREFYRKAVSAARKEEEKNV